MTLKTDGKLEEQLINLDLRFSQSSHLIRNILSMNTSSETLIDRTERLLKEDENYRGILEKLFLLDNQHFERYFIKCS